MGGSARPGRVAPIKPLLLALALLTVGAGSAAALPPPPDPNAIPDAGVQTACLSVVAFAQRAEPGPGGPPPPPPVWTNVTVGEDLDACLGPIVALCGMLGAPCCSVSICSLQEILDQLVPGGHVSLQDPVFGYTLCVRYGASPGVDTRPCWESDGSWTATEPTCDLSFEAPGEGPVCLVA
ncbi:MAG: hypothetical protein QOE90_1107 [Thermoplasmata archaeon]|nr:hypothetical protein [Thermoplasmata archaeon]